MDDLRTMPDEYWRERLTDEQYTILRKGGTEAPFSGALYHNHENGMYVCAGCDQPLFRSDAKFESGSGWPSFDSPVDRENVELIEDRKFGMKRVEARCRRCGAHLGHVFPDGPRQTTGERYCMNSLSLQFKPEA